jgi:hypothetical protein
MKMDSLTKEILTILKRQFINTNGIKKFDINMTSEMREYYLQNLDDNLIDVMDYLHIKEFKEGSGNEFKKKMRALRSSSALSYNTFRNINLILRTNPYFPSGKYSIEYEKKVKTLKKTVSSANIDVVLINENSNDYIFFEMKMLEWLSSGSSILRASYLDREKYFDNEYNEAFDVFTMIFNQIKIPSPKSGEFKSIFKRYDAYQMLKHSLAIYNMLRNGKLKDVKSITLVNCIWELKNIDLLSIKCQKKYIEILKVEKNEFSQFYNFCILIKKLFLNQGVKFDIIYLPHNELVNMIDMKPIIKNKLNRYII